MIQLVIHGTGRTATYRIAESWNDLTGPQLIAAAKVVYGETHQDRRNLRLLRIAAGMSWRQVTRLPAETIVEMLPLIQWMSEDTALTKNLLPSLRVGLKRYYGPTDSCWTSPAESSRRVSPAQPGPAPATGRPS